MRVKMSKPAPTRTYCKRNRPLPYVIQIVGRPGTGSLPSTIAPPGHPRWAPGIYVQYVSLESLVLRRHRSMKLSIAIKYQIKVSKSV